MMRFVYHIDSKYIYRYIAVLVILHFIVKIARKIYLWYTSPLRKIPGPPNLSFFFGYMLVILREPFMAPHKQWWNDYRKKHDGRSPPFIAYNNFFGTYSLCVLDPDIVKLVLTEPASRDPVRFPKRYFFLTETLGAGLATLEGTAWSRHRRIIQPSFQNVSFLKEALTKSVSNRIDRLLVAWRKVSGKGRDIDVASHMSAVTLDVIGDVAFSHDFGATMMLEHWVDQSNDVENNDLMVTMDPLIQAMRASMKLTIDVLVLSVLNMSWLEKYLNRKTARTRKLLNDAVDNVVQEARESKGNNNSNDLKENARPKSLLQFLFDATDSNDSDVGGGRSKLSDIELRDETKTFIIAGHETTSTWCYWALYALAKHPDMQQKVYDNIVKYSKSNHITIDEVDSMEYLSAFMNETLRLYSPVGLIFRFTSHDEKWHGYKIPKDTRVILPMHLLNRHPDHWSNPDEFIPERWLNSEECAARHKFIFIPFSAGGRNCVGQRFAEIEARLIVANICRSFIINLAPCMKDEEIKFSNFISMKSKPLIMIQAQYRG